MSRIANILLAVFLSPSFAAPKVVLTTVGEVGGEIHTSRSAQINAAVEQAVFQQKAKKIQIPEIGTVNFKKEVSALLMEVTVFKESSNFNAMKVPKSDINDAVKTSQQRLGALKSWKALDVTTIELQEVVKRKLRAKKFIRFKADSSVVPITNAEAKEYFEENRLKFGDLPFENFKENIKSYLSRQQVEKRLRDWFEVLQNKYRVKNFISEI